MISFVCVSCKKETTKLRKRGSTDTCQKCVKKEVLRKWKLQYPERKRALNQKWSELNREKDREIKRKWQLANPEVEAAKAAKYRAKKRRALPLWADLGKIKEIYKSCPDGFEVDHVIPLQGKLVSGLHVENNLQYLKALDNKMKSNKFVEGNP